MSEAAAADGRLQLSLCGCLDIASAPQLDARLRELESALRPVELDLERLTFIDLQGLRVLHVALIGARRGPWMIAVRPKAAACVNRLVALTGIELWPIPQPRTASIKAAAVGSRPRRTRAAAPRSSRLARR